jgi:hypothetical protein
MLEGLGRKALRRVGVSLPRFLTRLATLALLEVRACRAVTCTHMRARAMRVLHHGAAATARR